ncbi:MAG: proline dehydrogenase [Bacteroidetes bacterium 4572_112]|nr:MAG: proline dehydrogenase [Bacteroidetes bacterium 4572_112]
MKIDFNNTENAFISKTDWEINKAYVLFKTISSPTIVKAGNKMLNIALGIHFPINWAVKPTIYQHFVGGETIKSCDAAIEKLGKYNVKSILDYSVEGKEDAEDIRLAFEETLRAIENAGKNKNIPFAVFKPTAMGRSIVLEKASSGEEMNEQETAEKEQFLDRVHQLCAKAHEVDVPILIDAEHSWYQNIIDYATNTEMANFNKEKAIVFNTFQMYRHDRLAFLDESFKMSQKGGYFLGAKFVRGAYMEIERERAEQKGYQDPIQPTKEATDKDYNAAIRYCLERIDNIKIFNGTHNDESTQLMVDYMCDHKIPKDHDHCWFSQLYGMSDNISFNVAKEGFNVAKYLPYGPVKHVMPYLLRRAEENTSAQGQSTRELDFIRIEKNRRKKA